VKVAIGADHGGFRLKEALKDHIKSALGHDVIDLGTHSADPVDYPDFALLVARAVATGEAALGVMVDGAGIGSAMCANKVPGVRAALCYDVYTAANAREHNDANVLTLGGQALGEGAAKKVVETFLSVPFGGGRHERRIEKIRAIERRYMKEAP
jgi:ribose 5-phosphate isomerase B